jgi:hypothetical protein
MLMRGTVTFFAAVSIALAAPLAVAQSGGPAAVTQPAKVSNGYVESGHVTIQRDGKLIEARKGDKLYPGDVVSAGVKTGDAKPSLVIDGKKYSLSYNTDLIASSEVIKLTVPAAGGEVKQTTTSTKASKNEQGKLTSTTSTSTTVLVGTLLAVAAVAVASSQGNSKPASP